MNRRPLVQSLLSDRPPGLLVVSGLGSPSWDVCAAGDDPGNFHFIGAMGQAGPFALGVAMARPGHRVLLITGDGDMLMSVGVLATVANQAPANLAVLVLDNESYAETGGQPTATAGPTDLEAVARACGIRETCTVTNEAQAAELRAFLMETPGPAFAVAKIVVEPLPLALPPSFDGVTAMNRFREVATR